MGGGGGYIEHYYKMSVQRHAPASLHRGKMPPFHSPVEGGWAQGRSGRYREVKILDSTGTRTPNTWLSSP
jgi:hypothetical protein